MANRKITEFSSINGIDINEQDLLTLVHVFEADPTLRNKKITFTQFKDYLDNYYASLSGTTFTGNIVVSGNLTVSGASSFDTLTATGSSTFSGIVVQNNATVSGTISGLTLTGTNLQGTNLNAVTSTVTTSTGATANFVSGNFSTRVSGATVTGNQVLSTSGIFNSLSGVTITGTTVSATTGTFQTLGTPLLNILGDLSVASGLTVTGVAQFSSGVQVTGQLSGTTVTGTTASFGTVSGVSGVFTTQLSGATITGNTLLASNATGVSGTFTSRVSGATVTGVTGAFGNVAGISGIFTQVLSGTLITGDTARITTLTGVSGVFTNLSGATITGDTLSATVISGVSGVFNSRVSATTISGSSGIFNIVNAASGNFTSRVSGNSITGATGEFTTLTSQTGVFPVSVSGLVVTGDTGNFSNLAAIAGVFTTSVSGATVTGDNVRGTSGIFSTVTGNLITGVTVNAATGVFDTVAANNLAFTNTTVSGNFNVLGTGFFALDVQVTGTLSGTSITGTTVTATTGSFTSLTGTTVTAITGSFTSLTGTTFTGTTIAATTGSFTSLTGTTFTGTTIAATTGSFTSLTGTTLVTTTGLFASGSSGAPSISFVGDEDTGLFERAANSIGLAASGILVTVINNSNLYNYKHIYISNENDTAASAGQTTLDSQRLYLRGKYWDGASSQNAEWSAFNDVDGTGPNGTLRIQWQGSDRLRLDEAGRLYISGQTTRYLSEATGNYGSIQINGSGSGGWAGYSIDGGAVFMYSPTSSIYGLYNDVDNEWGIRHTRNGKTEIFYDGASKIETTTSGATVSGTCVAATFNATSTTSGGFQGIDADSATNPSFTWSADLNTGMYRSNTDQIGFTLGGTQRLNLGGDTISSPRTTYSVFDSTTTTINAFGAATTLNLGYDSTLSSITNINGGAVAWDGTGSGYLKTINIGTGGGAGITKLTLGNTGNSGKNELYVGNATNRLFGIDAGGGVVNAAYPAVTINGYSTTTDEWTKGSSVLAICDGWNSGNPSAGGHLIFYKHRSNNKTGNTAVAAGYILGQISFTGADGIGVAGPGAIIRSVATATPTLYSRARLEFLVNNNVVASPFIALRIEESGEVDMPLVYSDTVGATNRDLYIDSTGKLGYVSSTRASKTNIAPLSDVSWLHSLNPVSFNRRIQNEDESYSDQSYTETEYGLIAEEVEQIAPQLCFYDEVEGAQELRGIHYSKLIAPLLKAVQELTTQNEQLTQRVIALEQGATT